MTGSIMGGIFEKKRPKPCQVKNTSIANLFSLNSYQIFNIVDQLFRFKLDKRISK
jgi:hypothetical protein